MDIRGARLRKPSDEALEFTSSMAWDGRIARHVVRVNMAHMAALVRSGEVTREVGARCMAYLEKTPATVSATGNFEDFHQQLEQEAMDALGVETAGFLNYGKSRNDQVAAAIRMELRERLLAVLDSITDLQRVILKIVAKGGETLLPGYTHLQRAQPVTLAHHFLAYFDALQRDAERILQLYARVNLSPMGSAAMAGTAVKVERRFVAACLGFSGIVRNAMDAVSSRDIAVEALFCATVTMLDASRLAEELILWSSAEYGFVEISDAYSASSSIMPQKKNAVVAELVRAKAGSVMGDLVAACAILKALPYSYNLDLQEVTPQLWRAVDDTVHSLKVVAGALGSASFKKRVLADRLANDNSTAVALANYLVKNNSISFRQAHAIVGELVRKSVRTGKPLSDVASSGLPAVSAKFAGKRIRIDRAKVSGLLDSRGFLEAIFTEGGSNPRFTARELKFREAELSSQRSALSKLRSSLKSSERKLKETSSGLAREVKQRH